MDPVQEKIDNILNSLSDLMGIEVKFSPNNEDQGKVNPVYDINGILSKMIALFVFSGLNVPTTFPPPYNRVHADIEWWKKEMLQLPAAPSAPSSASEETPG